MIRKGTIAVPPRFKYLGIIMIVCSALLFVGGAVRDQSNMINSGLLFLCFGVLMSPQIADKGWILRAPVFLLAISGVVLTFVV